MRELKCETVKTYNPHTKSYRSNSSKVESKQGRRIGLSTMVPLAVVSPVMASASSGDGQYMTVNGDYSPPSVVSPVVGDGGATQWIGEKSLETLAHALDPVVQILVALSFPVASVVIVGACFLFMFGNPEGAWSKIQGAAMGFILVNLSPLILNVLKGIGESVV